MMRFKQGATLEGAKPEILKAAEIVRSHLWDMGIELVITSGTEGDVSDGVHKKTSKHYTGEAFDFRIWQFKESQLPLVVSNLQRKLGKDYDVVLEKTHIHVEYDPKTKAQARVKEATRTAKTVIDTIGGLLTALIPFYQTFKNLWKKIRGK